MHILFIHQNFPAQFGHIASYLAQHKGFRCTFLSEKPQRIPVGSSASSTKSGAVPQLRLITAAAASRTRSGTPTPPTSAPARPDIRPDLIVAHSGFLSTVFLRELYDCPIVNYFEYYYHTDRLRHGFSARLPRSAPTGLRARARNAICCWTWKTATSATAPPAGSGSVFRRSSSPKISTIFDGIDTNFWRHGRALAAAWRAAVFRTTCGSSPTFHAAWRACAGFDIFMKAAKLLCERRKDVLFVVVGQDRVCYGGDLEVTGATSFKEWVLSRDDYDLSRFLFTGLLPPRTSPGCSPSAICTST